MNNKIFRQIFLLSFFFSLFVLLILNSNSFGQGSATTEGLSIIRADEVRANGFTGREIKIGIIASAIKDIDKSKATGDIPSTYEAKSMRGDGKLDDTIFGNIGLGMMEIIHDIAPSALLYFSNASTAAEFVKAIKYLDNEKDCNIIVDASGVQDNPFWENGVIAQQVEKTINRGRLYICPTGDFAKTYYEGDFLGGEIVFEKGEKGIAHNFDGKGDFLLPFTIPAKTVLLIVMQWNDKWGKSGNNYDLGIMDANKKTTGISSVIVQNGSSEPYEIVQVENKTDASVTNYVLVLKTSGDDKKIAILAISSPLGITFNKYGKSSGSIGAHWALKNVLTVGAVSAATPDAIEEFSSRGPAKTFFPELEYWQKPDLCGVDNVSVTKNADASGKFLGTAAAAAHVAGAAALLWSAAPNKSSISANTIKNLLKSTAVDLEDAGVDTTYGYGRVDVYKAYEAYKKLSTTSAFQASTTESLSYVMAYPNPVKLSGDVKSFLFDNLKGDETIRLYTIGGEFITSYAVQQGNTSWRWDLKNSDSKEIAEGIYLYAISNSKGQRRTGKVVVVN